jgi:hypothetical protein
MRIPMPATLDYWVNDASDNPLFVVMAQAGEGRSLASYAGKSHSCG